MCFPFDFPGLAKFLLDTIEKDQNITISDLNNFDESSEVSIDDLKSKIPLCAKKNKNHKSIVKVKNVEFGGKKIPELMKGLGKGVGLLKTERLAQPAVRSSGT